MSYLAPYIDSSGLHVPLYTDIRDDMIATAKSIFGSDIYLGIDTMDYQYISAVALKLFDSMQSLQLSYNNRSPATAIGAGLDTLVKINGITRKPASYSTCTVILAGTVGTVINGGIVSDVSGNSWSLPATVIIGTSGIVSTTATSSVVGAVTAQAGEISSITTPTAGWISVANTVAASIGQAIETDSALRARQSVSTETPSVTVLEGIYGAISALPGVTRLQLYENDTGEVDSNGLPAHSITAVVEGGGDADIANAIYIRKTPGAYTNGTTGVLIDNSYGQTSLIRFYRPSYENIAVVINLKSLSGYTTEVAALIKANVAAYLNSLAIGQSLTLSALEAVAFYSTVNIAKPSFSITSLTAAIAGNVQGSIDIPILFHQVTQGNVANITINVT